MSELIRPPGPRAIIRGWRPLHNKGSLRGAVDIELPSGLVLLGVLLHESGGRRWAAPAGIPQLDSDGCQRLDPATGKKAWTASARFASREIQNHFSDFVIQALAESGVHPFDGEAPP